MINKKIKLAIFTGVVFASFATLPVIAGSTVISIKGSNAKADLSRISAKSRAFRKFGRNITVLSNRILKKSGCRRIVIKTVKGERETLKLCKK
ncbi:MAG TPA: hypothetical protein EYG68_05950 [Leucothrix mucor]|nr:hypothetical protein [Leucothrix mucor]